VELGSLLVAVQRHVRRVDVEHEFSGRCCVAGDELLDEHAVQCHGLGSRGARLQATQGGRGGQRIDPAHGSLHQQIASQRVVVVQVFVAAAQAVDALGQQVAQAVRDARGVAWVAEHGRGRTAQADTLVDAAQQQHATVRTEIATLEVGLDDAAPEASKLNSCVGTLWHRQSSVVIGVEYL
jgi:hypothetical protein